MAMIVSDTFLRTAKLAGSFLLHRDEIGFTCNTNGDRKTLA